MTISCGLVGDFAPGGYPNNLMEIPGMSGIDSARRVLAVFSTPEKETDR